MRLPSFLQGFNMRWNATQCKAIYLCYTACGTAEALDEAIDLYGKQVKIKSGGHCYENFVFNAETAAILDISPLNDSGLDPLKGYYLGSGGSNWSAFQTLFRDYGKVLPSGSCYSVGLGGHICGGGYGLLSRLNGLTVDWLTGVDVIVKDQKGKPSRSIYVSASSTDQHEKDLFWAHCGGGGGNFGIITKYYFKTLPDSPKSAVITSLAISWTEITNVTTLQKILDWFAQFSQHANNWRQFGILKLNHIVTKEIHIIIQTVVMDGETEAEIISKFVLPLEAQLRSLAKVSNATRPTLGAGPHLTSNPDIEHSISSSYTFYEATEYLNSSGINQRGKYKSAYMKTLFPADQVNTLFEWLTTEVKGVNLDQCLVQIDSYGGQINRVRPEKTAIPQRSSIMKLQYQMYWADKQNDAANLTWMREFYAAVYIASGGVPDPDKDINGIVDGCYYNYPDIDLNSGEDQGTALKLYFGQNLERLQDVKKFWDPENYFNSAQSIK